MVMTKICNTSHVPKDGVKGFNIAGKIILIANVGKKYYCLDVVCPHKAGNLTEGSIRENKLVCPQGCEFDLATGKKTKGPATSSIKSYRTEIRSTDIWADVKPLI